MDLKNKIGAGEGNRTLTASLEGWNSTVELHPLKLKSQFDLKRKSFFEAKFFEFILNYIFDY